MCSEFGSICPFVQSFATQDLRTRSQEVPQSPRNGSKISFWGVFDQNLVHLYVFFLLEYENANGFVTFCKNHVSKKNLVLDLWSKNLSTSENAIFFKLQYLTNKLIFEVEFLPVVRYL